MKKLIIILLFLLPEVNAQIENNIFYFPTTFNLNQLSGRGYSSLEGNASNINSLNPGALGLYSKPSAGISYQFESKIDNAWISDIGYKRVGNSLPQSAGIVFPYGNLTLAAGMNQLYNGAMDIGFILLTTSSQPDGTRIYLEPIIETSIYNYSFSAGYNLKQIFESDNNLSIGLRIGYNQISHLEDFGNFKTEEKLDALNLSAGFIYKINGGKNNLTLGLSYETGFDEAKYYQIQTKSSIAFRDSSGIILIPIQYLLRCKTPSRLSAGALYDLGSEFSLMGNLNYIFWKDVQKGDNEPQISGSVIYSLSKLFTPSVGFMYSSKTYDDNSFINVDNKMSALYFTFGFGIKYLNFNANLAIADSHLAGGEWRKHTIGKLTLGYSL